MNYHHLTEVERYQIQAGISLGMRISAIAKLTGRHRSTVFREVKRNGHISREGYSALYSIEQYGKRRTRCKPGLKIRGQIKIYVDSHLKKQWSPEQIVGRARLDSIRMVGTETIYRYVYRQKLEGGTLWVNLRHTRGRRKKRFVSHRWPKHIPRPSIADRPTAIADRSRVGDFERDLIVGTQRKGYLLTIVDRKTKLTKIAKIDRPRADLVHRTTVKALKGLTTQSITNDNGCEFTGYRKTAQRLKVPIYFTRPYASWERGTVENTNKLIRQYFPKRTDLSEVTDEKLKMVQTLLNHRPRKTLNYRTPNEETFSHVS